MNLLAIDVGNTNIVLGLFEDDRLLGHWRIQTVRERTGDEYGLLVRQFLASAAPSTLPETRGQEIPVDSVVLASVVPPLRPTMIQMCRTMLQCEPLEVTQDLDTGIPVLYRPATDVGADRIVNAAAAVAQFGSPCIVVDFGTATTFDAISRNGEYLGGAIAPGMGISMEALFQRAARLPRIEFRTPPQAIGRSTTESMQSGFVYGFVGQVEEIVRRFRQEIGSEAVVIATGGLAPLIAAETNCIDHVEPLLTLQGLRLIWSRWSRGQGRNPSPSGAS